jgi:hypothetical protein
VVMVRATSVVIVVVGIVVVVIVVVVAVVVVTVVVVVTAVGTVTVPVSPSAVVRLVEVGWLIVECLWSEFYFEVSPGYVNLENLVV